MKALDAPTLAHLRSPTTSFAVFWRIERKDGTVFGFTSNSRSVTISGTTYKATSGLLGSNVQSTAGRGVDNQNVAGIINSDDITEHDLINGLFDEALVSIFIQSYANTSLHPIVLVAGYIGAVAVGRNAFEAEIRSLSQRLTQTIGRVTGVSCRVADLGDARCGKDLTAFTFTGSVSAVVSRLSFRTTTAGIVAKAAPYFQYGKIQFTSGANDGRSVEVLDHTGGSPTTFVLMEPLAFDLEVGATFSIVAGCDRLIGTCNSKFSNGARFFGEPYTPGPEAVLRVIKQ